MGTKLRSAPVFFTLAQVRFNSVLALDRYLPEVQDGLRETGFPAYKPSTTQVFQITADGDGIQALQQPRIRHIFQNKQQTAAILLDTDALTFELSDYPVFDQFARSFGDALRVVARCLPLEFSERVGMRMLDAIQPLAGDSIEQYLAPEALGLSRLVRSDLSHQQTLVETHFKSEGRGLIVRSVRVNSGLAIPPDLNPLNVSLNERFTKYTSPAVMLDCDSYEQTRETFDVDELVARLTNLKAALSASFRSLVTDYALEVWQKESVG